MSYEFSDEEAEKMWIFGNQIMIFSAALFVIGVFGIGEIILTILRNPMTLEILFKLVAYIGTLVSSVFLIRPSDNFKKISVSEGRDISELMQGLKEFSLGFTLMSIVLLVISFFAGVLIIIGGR